MSELTSPLRVPKPGTSAIERARLALVPVRSVRAPRAPFAVLVFLLLGAGVVGLLMFNTKMQQDSFHATRLQQRADALTAQREALEMELDALRDPQALHLRARRLGMVPSESSGFVNLASGKISGNPTPAKSGDAVPVNSQVASLPSSLRPKPFYVYVPAKTPEKPADTGRASTDSAVAGGTNEPGTTDQEAAR